MGVVEFKSQVRNKSTWEQVNEKSIIYVCYDCFNAVHLITQHLVVATRFCTENKYKKMMYSEYQAGTYTEIN